MARARRLEKSLRARSRARRAARAAPARRGLLADRRARLERLHDPGGRRPSQRSLRGSPVLRRQGRGAAVRAPRRPSQARSAIPLEVADGGPTCLDACARCHHPPRVEKEPIGPRRARRAQPLADSGFSMRRGRERRARDRGDGAICTRTLGWSRPRGGGRARRARAATCCVADPADGDVRLADEPPRAGRVPRDRGRVGVLPARSRTPCVRVRRGSEANQPRAARATKWRRSRSRAVPRLTGSLIAGMAVRDVTQHHEVRHRLRSEVGRRQEPQLRDHRRTALHPIT